MDGLRDSVGSLVGGGDDRQWAGSVEDLLYDGETVRETVDLDGNRIVVTSHRVLTFMPEDEGENFRDVDLPNVADVAADADGHTGLFVRGVKAIVFGIGLAVGGYVLEMDGLVGSVAIDGEAAGQTGLGGMIGTLNAALALLGQLDEFMTMIGALLVMLAALFLGGYALTRERVLRIEVAGDEPDVQVGAPDDVSQTAVADLELALFDGGQGEPPSEDASTGGPDPLGGVSEAAERDARDPGAD